MIDTRKQEAKMNIRLNREDLKRASAKYIIENTGLDIDFNDIILDPFGLFWAEWDENYNTEAEKPTDKTE